MSIQRRFAPIGGRFEPEQVAELTGIYTQSPKTLAKMTLSPFFGQLRGFLKVD